MMMNFILAFIIKHHQTFNPCLLELNINLKIKHAHMHTVPPHLQYHNDIIKIKDYS